MFETLQIKVLKAIIRDYNLHMSIRGFSKMNKATLVSALNSHLLIDNNGNITLKESNYKNAIDVKPKEKKKRAKKQTIIEEPEQYNDFSELFDNYDKRYQLKYALMLYRDKITDADDKEFLYRITGDSIMNIRDYLEDKDTVINIEDLHKIYLRLSNKNPDKIKERYLEEYN